MKPEIDYTCILTVEDKPDHWGGTSRYSKEHRALAEAGCHQQQNSQEVVDPGHGEGLEEEGPGHGEGLEEEGPAQAVCRTVARAVAGCILEGGLTGTGVDLVQTQ